MSKLSGYLSYKDWYILKHSLEKQIKISQTVMDAVDEAIKGLDESQYTVDKYKKQKKELEEEKRTLERITKLVDNYKTYINSNERHAQYDSVPFDCK